MPYILPERREALRSERVQQAAKINVPRNAGELNFEITELILVYLEEKGLSYQTCNDVVGALDNAKHEFKRRIQNPYEREKINENGDLPGYHKYKYKFDHSLAVPTTRPN